MAVDALAGCGAEEREDRLEGLLHHVPLIDRVDSHHVGIRGQRTGAGAEYGPAAGQVIQQHPAIRNH